MLAKYQLEAFRLQYIELQFNDQRLVKEILDHCFSERQ